MLVISDSHTFLLEKTSKINNINIEKIIIDRKVIIIALVIDAEIIDKVTSAEDKGAPIKSTILPITLPIKIDDEELNSYEANFLLSINFDKTNLINLMETNNIKYSK